MTIWAKDALTADAIDDAVFILGPEKGLALVESIEDCGAVIVDEENKVWVSKRLEKVSTSAPAERRDLARPPASALKSAASLVRILRRRFVRSAAETAAPPREVIIRRRRRSGRRCSH